MFLGVSIAISDCQAAFKEELQPDIWSNEKHFELGDSNLFLLNNA